MSAAVMSLPRPVLGGFLRPNLIASTLVMMLGDLIVVTASIGIEVCIRHVFHGDYPISRYVHLWPVLPILLLSYTCFGLYPGVMVEPVAELRQATAATSVVFMLLSVATFMLHSAVTYSRSIFLVSWLTTLIMVPLSRTFIRRFCSRASWWGHPVVIFSNASEAARLIETIRRHPESGLRPVAILGNYHGGGERSGIPIAGGFDRGEDLARLGVRHAIISIPNATGRQIAEVIDRYAYLYAVVLVVSGVGEGVNLNSDTYDLCRIPSIRVRNKLLLRGPILFKRAIDLLLCMLVLAVAGPVLLLIALLIMVSSKGPALYTQTRIGIGGRIFKIWKFRTMVQDAEGVLREHLRHNPSAAEEWFCTQKLRDDPRNTRVGSFLRRTSLDELPQLWNVVIGDMSLVGPRPIVESEILRYGDYYCVYAQVSPGVTGLWQVSGRSNTSYKERVLLDNYYVRNWTPWLDFIILAQTIEVVLQARGAY